MIVKLDLSTIFCPKQILKTVGFTVVFFGICAGLFAQENTVPDVQWGNTSFFNLSVGERIYYDSKEIELLELDNHFNKIKVDKDTVWLKVSRLSLPQPIGGFRLYVADNKNVKNITDDKLVHGLLKKDALFCVSDIGDNMLDPRAFVFPISFNDGFMWSAQEDCHMFSYLGKTKNGNFRSYEGIGFDLDDARGIEKHWIVAIENSTVVWVEDKGLGSMGNEACVLLKSHSSPNVYYVYSHLYNKSIEVRKGQELMRGELIGTAWGNDRWAHFQLSAVYCDSVPTYENRFCNALNLFPQLYELYFKQAYSYTKSFTRGKVEFGKAEQFNKNQKNSSAFEEYSGKGWLLDKWNTADKVEAISKGAEGNVRLKKVLFEGEKARCKNPKNYYDYEINVKNGVYRVRAKVGDLYLSSWQKIDFEGINASTYNLKAGEQKWTTERAVKVKDRKLTVRIYVDKNNEKVAGLSEIVFQQAY